jgi:hypothetical protein
MLNKDLNSSVIGIRPRPQPFIQEIAGPRALPYTTWKVSYYNCSWFEEIWTCQKGRGKGAITKGRVIGFISLLLFALQLPFLSFSLLLPHGKHALYNIHVVLEEKIIRSIHTLVLGTLVLSCLAPC